jgi:acyltransferase-like protein
MGRWVTWAFQVMPVFFLVGGYANARSWTAHHAQGEYWSWWIQRRTMRLWWPTAMFLGAGALAILAARTAGTAPANIALSGRLITMQLWFLPVYLALIALTPVMHAAHRRWGLAVPAGMATVAALVSAIATVPHLRGTGNVNYLLVWGSIHQCGFAWRDGTLTRARWRPYALAAGGAALLAGLVTSGAFPADMVGLGNTNPPSTALLAYAAAQVGLVLAAKPAATRLLATPRRWHVVQHLNNAVITVYLWHFVPVLIIAPAFYPTGMMPQPTIGTARWWELRPAWLALLIIALVPMTVIIMRAEQPMTRLPAGIGPPRSWSPGLLLAGLAATFFGLAQITITGLAPGGHLSGSALANCTVGLTTVLLAGRAPAPDAIPQVLRPQ